MNSTTNNQAEAQRITLIGAFIDLILGLLKIVFGVISHSSALLADGIHSLSDLLTDFLVVAIIKYSHQEPDEDHPWGHARFETIGTVILGCILVAVAGAMAYESVLALLESATAQLPEWPALVIAAISVASKEAIFRYTLAVGQRIKSDLIIANAWHSRTDAFSSIVVFVGVAGAMSGLAWLDAFAAIIVAFIVAKIGWELTWKSIKELVDTALPEEQLKAYTESIMQVEGVISVHSFKSRNMGSQSLLEMHLQVAPHLSASEGHYIGDAAVYRLKGQFEDIGHVIFHIDTYDDEEEENYCKTLPMRTEVSGILWDALDQCHAPHLDISRLTLHYRSDAIEIDLMLLDSELNRSVNTSELEQQLGQHFSHYPWFGGLHIWYGTKAIKL
ncbi:cation diffusion facilitator family transporter [Amphritea balenae]|uniref:Cation transporter n=1 Tax=Amphritea balenae TaxID=452629 RepID=A0A3P1SM91_9GAMM|nr:cation diffusion facilitator family transporter [Amphritea balenae]RRC97815.1 cation transporter [Amphritea balenae]GGK83209.1 cation diffusion facilitator transporter [Amphritea balenae]